MKILYRELSLNEESYIVNGPSLVSHRLLLFVFDIIVTGLVIFAMLNYSNIWVYYGVMAYYAFNLVMVIMVVAVMRDIISTGICPYKIKMSLIGLGSTILDWPLGERAIPDAVKSFLVTLSLLYASMIADWHIIGLLIVSTSMWVYIAQYYKSVVALMILDTEVKDN